MDAYTYIHNLKTLNAASFNEEKGYLDLHFDGNRLESPIGIRGPAITVRIKKILLEMTTELSEMEKKQPFLFQISETKFDTPESIKIRKIFQWAGDFGDQINPLIGLYQRPQVVPTHLNTYSGFFLTEKLAQRNALTWKSMNSRCLGVDLCTALRSCKTFENSFIFEAYYVVSCIPNGLSSYRAFKSYLSEVDKTVFLCFLIYKNGGNLLFTQGLAKRFLCTEGPKEYRKKIIELYIFSEELQILNQKKNFSFVEKELALLNKNNIRIDYKNRVVGYLKKGGKALKSVKFESACGFGKHKPGDIVDSSFMRDLDDEFLVHPSLFYQESYWASIANKKMETVEKAKRNFRLFNDVSYPLMKKAEELGYLKYTFLEEKYQYSIPSKLLIYFLSYLEEHHASTDPYLSLNESEIQKFKEDPKKFFSLSTNENKYVIMGLWIKDVLEGHQSIDKKDFEGYLLKGSIVIKLLKEFGENNELLSVPVVKGAQNFNVLHPLFDVNMEEAEQILTDYFATSICKEISILP